MSFETIKDIVDFNPSRPLSKGKEFPFIDMASLPVNGRDINEVSNKVFNGGGAKFKNGDTLFARITPCLENGKTAKVENLPVGCIAHGSTEFIVLSAKSKDDEDFVYYLARLPDFRSYAISRMEGTSGRQRVSWQALAEFNLRLPEKGKRKKIGKILKSLDDKIHLNNQINQTLESIAQAIFKSWFIDFEPVRAKIAAKQEGKDPELAAMCAISGKSEAELDQLTKEDFAELQATAALFPDELVESELGEVPRGWSSVSIGSLIDLTIGGDWGKEVKDEKYKVQARVIRGTDIPSIKIGLDEQVPTRYIESKKLRTRELKLGDIVIEVSGGSPKQPTGRTIYISNEILLRLKDPVIPASFCRLLRPNSHELGVFLSIYLQKIYVEGKTWLYQNQSTGISNFQTTVFLEKEILTLPPLILLEEFEKIITPIIKKIDSSERLFLSNLRDTLLPKLLSGEVDLQGEGIDG